MQIEKLKNLLKGEPAFRERQVFEWIYAKAIENWDMATNLSKELREKLKKDFSLEINYKVSNSADKNTKKVLITLDDGLKIEAVLMRHKDNRNTVCVSSQVGCALGCKFCATGSMGLKRSLTYMEIVDQVLIFERMLKKDNARVTNVTFMGMGEPFLNYDEVILAAKFIQKYFEISARKISFSTVGVVDGIKKLTEEKDQYNLAFSMHAPNDELRSSLIPFAKKNSLKEILKAISDYMEATHRKVMIEYVLIDGINDRIENAKELVVLLKQLKYPYVVNLILCNQVENFKPSSENRAETFKEILERADINTVERFRFGRDVSGACGRLVVGR